MKDLKIVAFAVLVVASIGTFALPAAAIPTGHLDIGICGLPNAGVTLTSTTIDWTPPAGGPNGCITTGAGTLVTYTGGAPLVSGVPGMILDVPASPPPLVVDFMTFPATPNLHFDLVALGPGPANTTCNNTFDPNAAPCSVAGTPYQLQSSASGTSLTIAAQGTARDAAGSSPWVGVFTTQFAGRTPLAVQQNLLAGGQETSTESGDFTLTVQPTAIPEPTTLLLVGSGVIGTAIGLRRRRR